jgi:hypothetical protein
MIGARQRKTRPPTVRTGTGLTSSGYCPRILHGATRKAAESISTQQGSLVRRGAEWPPQGHAWSQFWSRSLTYGTVRRCRGGATTRVNGHRRTIADGSPWPGQAGPPRRSAARAGRPAPNVGRFGVDGLDVGGIGRHEAPAAARSARRLPRSTIRPLSHPPAGGCAHRRPDPCRAPPSVRWSCWEFLLKSGELIRGAGARPRVCEARRPRAPGGTKTAVRRRRRPAGRRRPGWRGRSARPSWLRWISAQGSPGPQLSHVSTVLRPSFSLRHASSADLWMSSSSRAVIVVALKPRPA